ncbi:MAG: single-stranded DNA-binding protein [Bulleidia sp.]
MTDRNETVLVGTVFGEPRLGSTKTGGSVATFSLAVKRKGSDKITDIIPITAWDEEAQKFEHGLKDGDRVEIHGSIQRSTWIGENGERRWRIKVNADTVISADDGESYMEDVE